MTIKKALIVDDSKSACFVLARMLRHFHIESDYVLSAHAAFEYLTENAPSVIFMDHSMPDMDGIQAVEEIKRTPKLSDIPIIMFTAKTGDAYHQKAQQVGAVDVMPKTMDIQNLALVLKKAELVEQNRQPNASDAEMPSAEQKLQVWIESVIENKLAPTLNFRIDQATKEIREETTQNSDRLYRNSLQFHIRQQKQLVKQIEAERDYLSLAYQTNQESLFKKITASLAVLVMLVLSVLGVFWFQVSELTEQTQAQIAEINQLQTDYYQQMKINELEAVVSQSRSKIGSEIPGSSAMTLYSSEGAPVARVMNTRGGERAFLAQSFTNYQFSVNEKQAVSQFTGERYFISQDCFGDIWIESSSGRVVSDVNRNLWFTPADSAPVVTDVFSRMNESGECENFYKASVKLVPLLPNDPAVTGIEQVQFRLRQSP